MAHQVETMSYFGKTPWHKLGSVLEENDIYDWPIVCAKSGLDWTADLQPLYTKDGVEAPVFAVQRNTDKSIVGVVGKKYHILQNRAAFSWFEPFLTAKEAILHTAGSLCNGSRVWVLAKLQRDPIEIMPNDLVEKYILLSHSHDGTLAIRVGFTPIRVVCGNTLAMAHNTDASKLIRIRHSASMQENLLNVREVMNVANAEFEATAEQYKKLARKDINQNDLKKYIKIVMGLEKEKDEDISTRAKNQMGEIYRLFEHGAGNNLHTWWSAYNGVTEWLSYNRGSDKNRLNNLWFGEGAKINKLALETALVMAI